MSKTLKCPSCDNELTLGSLSMKFVGGRVRYANDICSECGDVMELKDPKSGVPSMQFFDNGSGKKKVL